MYSFIFAQAGNVCTVNDPFEWVALIALISGAGIFSISTGVAGVAIATTIIDMISTGASAPAIASAVSGQAIAGTGSAEILTSIVVSIKGILGC